ncbi:transporter [Palleronia sediminis]|uniref:Transporter n=1 Tax=Palleronia sediminis TaxID=2547833 RepID=A0A4V3BAS8_9RHOB|nr:transporter [Palleronia sediminis]
MAAALALPAVPASAETLADALVLAYRHSGLLEKNRAVLRAADEDVAQAVATLRPVIDYAVSASRNWVFPNDEPGGFLSPGVSDTATNNVQAQITGSLLLWDGGASRLAISAAKEAVLATREALVQVEQQVLGSAVQAYLNIQEAQAFVNLRQSNVALLQQQLDASRERFEVGEITRTDVALAEAQLASARSLLEQALGDVEIAKAQYINVVGEVPRNLAPVTTLPQLPNSVEAAIDVAKKTHPSIRQAQRLVTLAEINVLRAERAIRPQLSANTSVSIDQDYTERASIGLNIGGPIYRGGALTSQYRQAVARRDEERADLHVSVDDIINQVRQAWVQLDVAQSQIAAQQLAVRAARVAYEGLQEEASLGARTLLDVLDAEQDLQDARANLISAEISRYVAAYSILSTMGLLTVDHLGLGIVTYDFSLYYNAVEDAPIRKVSPQGEKLDRLIRSLGRQ